MERAIIAMPEASHQSRRRALEICRRAGAQALTVPSYQDLVSGKVIASQLRNVKLDDLHSRNPVLLDESRLQEWIGGRSVFVTGDGGSIGSELCRQIARFEPARLVLFEHNESALYRAEREFAEQHLRIRLHGILDDVRNAARVAKKLAEHRPEIVFHAAAYNHVPLLKEDNALAAVQNNVFGTMHVAEAAIALGVEKFVMVSADKGVAPDRCNKLKQASGGNCLPGTPGTGCHEVHHRALWKCAYQYKPGNLHIPRADRAWRPYYPAPPGLGDIFQFDPRRDTINTAS